MRSSRPVEGVDVAGMGGGDGDVVGGIDVSVENTAAIGVVELLGPTTGRV